MTGCKQGGLVTASAVLLERMGACEQVWTFAVLIADESTCAHDYSGAERHTLSKSESCHREYACC